MENKIKMSKDDEMKDEIIPGTVFQDLQTQSQTYLRSNWKIGPSMKV